MRVLIAGGGIGGLTAALSLHAAGIEAEVFESAQELRPLGVGINLLPHAVRELTELGLAERLAATGIATRELRYINVHGQLIWAEPRGLAAGYRWPQYSIHRGRLQMLLWEAARERLGPARLHTGRRVVATSQDRHSATLHFADGSRVSGDAIVAADGIHSAVRAERHPDEGPPRWKGAVLWRATSIAPPFLDGATMIQCGHHRLKFVCYPIANHPDGTQLINWIAERVLPADTPWNREDWNRRGSLDDVIPHYADWVWPWLDVPALMRRAEAVYEFPMVDRDPLPRWSVGRITLLGDAAHPMYPIGSNGASQAILDARVLAMHLKRARSVEEGLAAYEAARLPPTAALTEANRGLGPDVVLEIAHQRAPQGFRHIHDVIPEAELAAIAARYKQLAGFDPASLNARESYSA
ncbi:MAG: flavin-dependent oxidoreductase [Rhodovarius sp.]|nr:flavin-dependent oxidoreductase [Rhodovarius sp.]MDW8314252.1 flavin-dependent oxidoreductase [Rhodovarius sp.]